MLTCAQNALYFRLWSAVTDLQPGVERHEFHRKHDLPDSHLDFTNDHFDAYIGACKAVINPGDLNAQLRQVRGAHRRARFSLDRLMRKQGVGRNYVQGIIDQMCQTHPQAPARARDRWQDERDQPARPSRELDSLTEPELKKVIIALRKQGQRAKRKLADHDVAKFPLVEVPFFERG